MSLLPTTGREYSTRTGPNFTVRSANSVSYSLRPLRNTRSQREEEQEGCRNQTYISEKSESMPHYQSKTCSGVIGQSLESDKMSIKQKSPEFVTDPLRNSEREGRTEWRRSTLSSRSKSLDWRAGAKSPERSYRTDIWTNTIADNRGTDRESSRLLSTIEVYNTANTGSNEGAALTRGNRGQSLPSNLRSQSVSLGPKAGHSILERIEKLYGSSVADNTGDYNTRAQEPSYRKTSLGGTFPRRFSSGEYRPSSSQSGEYLTWTNFKDSLVSSTPGINRNRPLSGQWYRAEDEGGSFQNTGLSDIGTRSLDRARSRCTKAAQIRAARAAEEMAKTTQSNAVLEGISEVCTGTKEIKTKAFEDKEQDWKRWSVKERSTEKVEDQMEKKGHLWMKRDSTSDDVFESNSQKIQLKSNEKKPLATSVRNKINQFEALTQRAQTSAPRRAFSVPAHLSTSYDRVQKSSSDRDIGTGKYRWERKEEGVTEIKTFGSKKYDEIKRDNTVKKDPNLRTTSVDETNLNMIKQGTEKESQNNKYSEVFNKYSKLKTTLDLPLKKDPYQVFSKDFNIDETDFSKIASPVEVSDDDASSSSGPLKPDFAANSIASLGEKKQNISGSSTPVSDNDKTPTNTPDTSPFLSPISAPQKTTTFDYKESETQNNTPKEENKTPNNENLDILPSLTSSNLPDLVNPNNMNGKKRVLDLNAWLDGLNPQIKVWGDDNDDDDDDDSTQKDEDSNYDSDSGESSVTVTSNMSNKSFSVSLADLCNFAGVDYESENDSDEWQSTGRRSASLSSDMSVFSYVSVLPTEELDKLIEDVRGIGDDNLQNYEDVHVVVLHKDMGVGLGFSLAGGVDQNKPVTVHKVFHSGVAAKEGSIREGDIVLSINGTALSGCAHWEALRVLRRAKSCEMGVVVLKKPDVSKLSNGNANRGPTATQVTETGQRITVCLQKNIRDLGFSLEGGVGSSLGNKPLTVQKIFQGGPIEKVLPGDEVLEINGVSVVGMRRLEAWTLIRKLAPGPINVVLRRHPPHQPIKT